MNIKFYEALDIDNNEVKDISTDIESEDNNSNNEKRFIKITDYSNNLSNRCYISKRESNA